MKFKKIATMAAALTLASTMAHADVFLFKASPNACSTLPGHWVGTGHVDTTVYHVHVSCDYNGDGNITAGSTPGQFNMHMNLNSSSFMCPTEVQDLVGTCSDGNVTLRTDQANLSGTVSDDGKANIHGTVTFIASLPIVGKKTITANVSNLVLNKR